MHASAHRRFNPLTGEWVLVSPHRANRPWHGQVEKAPPENLPPYDPGCYLCPRNERAGGARNPCYSSTFVFDNDFSSLLPAENPAHAVDHPLLVSVYEQGICRVVCFTPRHDLTLPEFDLSDIENIICTWTDQTMELSAKDFVQYLQIFENKGAMMAVPIHIRIARFGELNISRMSPPKSLNTRKPTLINTFARLWQIT